MKAFVRPKPTNGSVSVGASAPHDLSAVPLPVEVYLISGAPGVPGVPGQPKSFVETTLNSLVHTLICSGAWKDDPCPVTFAPLVHAGGVPIWRSRRLARAWWRLTPPRLRTPKAHGARRENALRHDLLIMQVGNRPGATFAPPAPRHLEASCLRETDCSIEALTTLRSGDAARSLHAVHNCPAASLLLAPVLGATQTSRAPRAIQTTAKALASAS